MAGSHETAPAFQSVKLRQFYASHDLCIIFLSRSRCAVDIPAALHRVKSKGIEGGLQVATTSTERRNVHVRTEELRVFKIGSASPSHLCFSSIFLVVHTASSEHRTLSNQLSMWLTSQHHGILPRPMQCIAWTGWNSLKGVLKTRVS